MAWQFITKAQAATYLNEVDETSIDDLWSDIIEGLILERYRHTIGEATFTEYYSGDGSTLLELNNTPIVSITSIAVVGPPQVTQEFSSISEMTQIIGKYIKRTDGGVWPEGDDNLYITYVGGTDTIDPRLKWAELNCLAYIYKFRLGNLGDDSIKFGKAGALGTNQYSSRPGITRKIEEILEDTVPRKIFFR